MDLKNDILAMWESRDRCRTSSLGPTFTPSSVGASEKRSTLGDTFIPSKAMVSATVLHSSGHGLGEMPSLLSRPLGPPPGIPYPSMPTSYGQTIFPNPNYSTVGSTMGYNFNPMMGQPLQPSILSGYPFLMQSPGMLFSTSISMSLADLPALLDIEEEECPLVVETPSHSSQVVVGGTIPTITVSLSAVETTLSASPRLTPRISTSSANMTGGDCGG